jgi:hypothetical protein
MAPSHPLPPRYLSDAQVAEVVETGERLRKGAIVVETTASASRCRYGCGAQMLRVVYRAHSQGMAGQEFVVERCPACGSESRTC